MKNMSDFSKLLELLNEFDVPYTIEHKKLKNRKIIEVILSANGRRKFDKDIKVEGYESFYTVFEFDENGRFNIIGIWE